MTQLQTPSERTAWLRARAKHHGMSVQECAQYIAELRKQYRAIAGPGARVVSAMGLGWIAVPESIRADAEARLLAMLEHEAA